MMAEAKDVPDLIAQMLRTLPQPLQAHVCKRCLINITEHFTDEQLGEIIDILEKT